MSGAGSNPYRGIVLRSLPRLLSLVDRDPFSPTFGCFDRPFWHYKTCSDFASAVCQQGALPLALLYRYEIPGNPCFRSPRVLETLCAAMRFWTSLRNRDGSFNEWYPGEHSHVATAFTAYAVSEALLVLGDEIPGEERGRIVETLVRAARWLGKYVDREVINHSAGALAALANIHRLEGSPWIAETVDQYIEVLREGQNGEGWFGEYGGADIGYQGVTLDYLAKYLERSGDDSVTDMIERGLGFLVPFVTPRGTCGGPIGSRSTRYLLPHGLEILNGRCEEAGDVLKKLWRGLALGTAIGPEQVDDRYFTFFFFPNMVQACVHAELRGDKETVGPCEEADPLRPSSLEIFSESGLVAERRESYTLLSNLKRGGVMRVHSGDTDIYSDSGYFGELADGRVVSTNWLNHDARVDRNPDGSFTVQTRFIEIDYSYPLKRFLIPFRLFNVTAGRSGPFMWAFNRALKSRRIAPSKTVSIEFTRTIMPSDEGVLIRDRIRPAAGLRFKRLRRLEDISTGHVPTSRYWVSDGTMRLSLEPDLAEAVSGAASAVLVRRVAVEAGRGVIEVSCENKPLWRHSEPTG